MNKNPYKLSLHDLAKRRGDRRRMILEALVSAAAQHRRDKDVSPTLTPIELAKAWKLHPSSTYGALRRLYRAGAVSRQGVGLHAEYQVTEKGVAKLVWLNEVAGLRERISQRSRRAAANPEEE